MSPKGEHLGIGEACLLAGQVSFVSPSQLDGCLRVNAAVVLKFILASVAFLMVLQCIDNMQK